MRKFLNSQLVVFKDGLIFFLILAAIGYGVIAVFGFVWSILQKVLLRLPLADNWILNLGLNLLWILAAIQLVGYILMIRNLKERIINWSKSIPVVKYIPDLIGFWEMIKARGGKEVECEIVSGSDVRFSGCATGEWKEDDREYCSVWFPFQMGPGGSTPTCLKTRLHFTGRSGWDCFLTNLFGGMLVKSPKFQKNLECSCPKCKK